jgi:peptidoglycan/LPS O-acetylase OafA/YrhL
LSRISAIGKGKEIRRIDVLDGLRGMAILLVLLHHGLGFEATSRGDALLKLLFAGPYGWCGVDLFFVLSGFLITGILLDTKNSRSYFQSFYMRRVLRIFPLYYGALALYFYVLPSFSTWAATAFHGTARDRIWFWSYLMNYRTISPTVPLGHFWSLCIEEQFYLFWPLCVWMCNRRVLGGICAGLVAGSLLLRVALLRNGFNYDQTHFFTITRLDSLALGAAIAIAARSGLLLRMRNNGILQWSFWCLATGLVAMAILTTGLPRNNAMVETYGLTLLDCFFAAGLAALLTAKESSLACRFFNNGILRSFGKYSYAMYVFNWPIVVFCFQRVSSGSRSLPLVAGSQVPVACIFAVATIVLTYLTAMASYHAYEKHFLKLKRWFMYERSPSS